MDKLVDASAAYLVRQLQAGVDAVQIFDTWAGVLPAEEFARWCIGPTQRIVARIGVSFSLASGASAGTIMRPAADVSFKWQWRATNAITTSSGAPSCALKFAGRWDRCFRRLRLRHDHSNAG